MRKPEKVLVLYSGGLDSRLVVKILKEEGHIVEALHFNLPFGSGCCNLGCSASFTQLENVKLTIIDVTKGKLLKEYLELIKNPRHGVGTGINPCRDCKIFMFRHAKEYADKKKIKIIATGEVLGQRPMSQTRHAMEIIDKRIGFEMKRPLIERGFEGRQRIKQRELAKRYGIEYPEPAGGCLLCDKVVSKRLKFLFEKGLVSEKTLNLTKIGRHFFITSWYVVGRNEKENVIIETFKNSIESEKGTPAVYYHNSKQKSKAIEIQKLFQDRKQDELGEYKI